MDANTIIVPPEDRVLIVVKEDRVIEVPKEFRTLYVYHGGVSMLGSKIHTVGNTTDWVVDYSRWLKNAATIASAHVNSTSATCPVATSPPAKIQGKEVVFYLTGGALNEQFTVNVQIKDSFGNVKNDTINYTVVPP